MDIENNEEKLLFKYTPINVNLIRLLVSSKLWFSSFNKLNDPFEGQFEIEKFDLPCDEILEKIYKSETFKLSSSKINYKIKMIKKNPSKFYNDLKRDIKYFFFNRLKVACFSLTYSEILMWSHYANEHKGVCLIFDKNLLKDEDALQKLNPSVEYIETDKVNYKMREKLKVKFDKRKKIRAELKNAQEIIFEKLPCWEYEKEYRILAKNYLNERSDGITFSFNKNTLRGVIFGEKCCYNDIRLIFSILNAYGYVEPDFLWGASRIVSVTGKLVSIKKYGKIDVEEFIFNRYEWLTQSFI